MTEAIETLHKMVNDVSVPLTQEEIEEFKAREEAWASSAASRADADARREINRLETEAGLPRSLRDIIKKDSSHGAYAKVMSLEARIEELKTQFIKE